MALGQYTFTDAGTSITISGEGQRFSFEKAGMSIFSYPPNIILSSQGHAYKWHWETIDSPSYSTIDSLYTELSSWLLSAIVVEYYWDLSGDTISTNYHVRIDSTAIFESFTAADGTFSGTITDGTTSIAGGSITGTNTIESVKVEADTLTDGVGTLTAGALSGITTIDASGDITVTGADISGDSAKFSHYGGHSPFDIGTDDSTLISFSGTGIEISGDITLDGNIIGGSVTLCDSFLYEAGFDTVLYDDFGATYAFVICDTALIEQFCEEYIDPENEYSVILPEIYVYGLTDTIHLTVNDATITGNDYGEGVYIDCESETCFVLYVSDGDFNEDLDYFGFLVPALEATPTIIPYIAGVNTITFGDETEQNTAWTGTISSILNDLSITGEVSVLDTIHATTGILFGDNTFMSTGVGESGWAEIPYIKAKEIKSDYHAQTIDCDTTLIETECVRHAYAIADTVIDVGEGMYYLLSEDMTQPCLEYFDGSNGLSYWDYPYIYIYDDIEGYIMTYESIVQGDTANIALEYAALSDIDSWWTQDSATLISLETEFDADSIILPVPEVNCFGITWTIPSDTVLLSESTYILFCDTLLDFTRFCADWFSGDPIGFPEIYISTDFDTTYYLTETMIYGRNDTTDNYDVCDTSFSIEINGGLLSEGEHVLSFYVPDGCVECDTTEAGYDAVEMPHITVTEISAIKDTTELCPEFLYTGGFDLTDYGDEEGYDFYFYICDYQPELCGALEEGGYYWFEEIYLYGDDTIHITNANMGESAEPPTITLRYDEYVEGCEGSDNIRLCIVTGETTLGIDEENLANYFGFYIPPILQTEGYITMNDTTIFEKGIKFDDGTVMTTVVVPDTLSYYDNVSKTVNISDNTSNPDYSVLIGGEVGSLASLTGTNNVIIGYKAGDTTTTGTRNVFIGSEAGRMTNTNFDNVYVGNESGKYSTEYQNTFVGSFSGSTSSGNENTYLGHESGSASYAGTSNTFVGSYSGYPNRGMENVMIGKSSGRYKYGGHLNVIIGKEAGQGDLNKMSRNTGTGNVIVGGESGYYLRSGSDNVFMGYRSAYNDSTGHSNTYIGAFTGYSNYAGSNNICIGDSAGYSETGNRKLYIESSNSATPLIYGEFDNDIVRINGTKVERTDKTIADNDATPDVSASNVWTYAGSANAVTITDLDNPDVGAIYYIIGNSDTYTVTIGDSGNFNLSAQWVGGLDDVLILFVQADNDYIELGRVNN
jgi:hypothetical protein